MKTLKKLLKQTFVIIILSLCLFSSCDERAGVLGDSQIVNGESIKDGYQVVEIEGCEYIYYSESHGYSGFGFLAHKGNCKNPIHYQNKVTVVDTVEYQLIRK